MDFTLGGKTAAELGLELLEQNTILPGTAPTRDRTVVISGRHGEHDFGAVLGPVEFHLDCLTLEIVPDFRATIRSLNDFLFDNQGKPKTLALEFSNEAGRVYFVRYRGKLEIDKSSGPVYRRVMIPLWSKNPFAFGDVEEVEVQITTSPIMIPIDVDSGINVPLTLIFDNEGATTLNGFSFKTYDEIQDWRP